MTAGGTMPFIVLADPCWSPSGSNLSTRPDIPQLLDRSFASFGRINHDGWYQSLLPRLRILSSVSGPQQCQQAEIAGKEEGLDVWMEVSWGLFGKKAEISGN
jgi:hypothetical protein